MKTIPVTVRLDRDLQIALQEGAQRTTLNRGELIRLTLRRYLRNVIEQEIVTTPARRITNIEPWPRKVVEAAYRLMGKEWDKVEGTVTHAQGKPDLND
jgi:hypothetical protein